MVFESVKRSVVKAVTYRIIHYFIHIMEAYITVWFFARFGHVGIPVAVLIGTVFCFSHYLFHERLFARVSYGYKKLEEEE